MQFGLCLTISRRPGASDCDLVLEMTLAANSTIAANMHQPKGSPPAWLPSRHLKHGTKASGNPNIFGGHLAKTVEANGVYKSASEAPLAIYGARL